MTLRVRGLTVIDRSGRAVLDRVDLTAAAGRVSAVVGPSGSGKSTLLHAALGVLPPGRRAAAGTVTWDGAPRPDARSWRRRTVGLVGQDPRAALHPLRTALAVVAETAGSDAARAALRATGLDPDRHGGLAAHQLSGGQAQRVALARAVAGGPALLVLDEPTSALDAAALRVAAGLVRAHRDSGGAVLLVSHDRSLVAELADDVLDLARATPIVAPARPAVPKGPVVLEATGVTLRPAPGAPVLLDGAALTLRAGELVALTGPSGCGKSTLLHALAGLSAPERGVLRLRGAELPWTAGQRGGDAGAIALVGQHPAEELNPARRAGATVIRPLRTLRGLSRTAAHAEAARLLGDVGLPADAAARRPDRLSGGQRQRVSLARALAGQPAVLLADEATAALDTATAAHLLALLHDLRSAGLAVLAATHDPDLARHADRVVPFTDLGATPHA